MPIDIQYPAGIPTSGGTMTGPILQADGSAAAPSYSFSSASSLGIYKGATNLIAVVGSNLIPNFSFGQAISGIQIGMAQSYGIASIADAVAGTADTKLTRASAGTFSTTIGTGTATANIGGTYAKFVSGTGVGNGADTTNDALWTLTAIPANTFTANGDALILTLGVQFGANANNKTLGVTVGGSQVTTGASPLNGQSLIEIITITRVDATHVNVFLLASAAGASLSVNSVNLVVADLTANTLAVVVTGASPTTGAANDVKLYSGVAEFKK